MQQFDRIASLSWYGSVFRLFRSIIFFFIWVLHIMNLVDVNHTKGVHHTHAHTPGKDTCARSSIGAHEQLQRTDVKSASISNDFLRANLNQRTNERTHTQNARMMGRLSGMGHPTISRSFTYVGWRCYPQPVGEGILSQDLPSFADLHNIFVTFFSNGRITHCRHCLELWFARLDGALIFSPGHNKMQSFKFPMVAETKQSRCIRRS